MNFIVLIFVFCGVGAVLAQQGSATRTGNWWNVMRRRIEFPCWTNAMDELGNPSSMEETSADSETDNNDYDDNDNINNDDDDDSYEPSPSGARERDCIDFDRPAVTAVAREAEDSVSQLLQHQKVRRWVRGRLADIVDQKRCDLSLTVAWRSRAGLTPAETKVTHDLIQLESYSHYLKSAASKFRSRRDVVVRKALLHLSKLLRTITCNLRPAVTESLLARVTRDDVPVDLRQATKGTIGRVDTYVILEELQAFLRMLPGTYRRQNHIKLCP